jgi:hypothetical protein
MSAHDACKPTDYAKAECNLSALTDQVLLEAGAQHISRLVSLFECQKKPIIIL